MLTNEQVVHILQNLWSPHLDAGNWADGSLITGDEIREALDEAIAAYERQVEFDRSG